MTGALMQLVAYGAQDIYLTGNPMITYFKVVYRRHTNFAMESIQQTYNGNVGFGKTISVLVSRNGDLVTGVLLEITVPALTAGAWVHDIGNYLISQVDLEIGGQLIDRHYGDWLEIWSQLTVTSSKRLGYNEMIGEGMVSSAGAYQGLQSINDHGSQTLMVPLQFWFCRNVGLALPLIALQYHEVKLNVTFANLSSVLLTGTVTGNLNCDIYVDYIYLDTDERRRFAQVSHEYLIEQVQFNGEESYSGGGSIGNYSLSLNHPVKELIWTCQDTSNKSVVTTPNAPACKLYGGNGNEYSERIYVDKDGNIFVCGSSNSATLNGVNNNDAANRAYVAKFSPTYEVLWHKWIYGCSSSVQEVKCDTLGNVYFGGRTFENNSISINGTIYAKQVAGSANNPYAVKLNGLGEVIWVKWIAGGLTSPASAFSLDTENNMYFGVSPRGANITLVNLVADGTEVPTRIVSGAIQGAIYKIAPNGTILWYVELTGLSPFAGCIVTGSSVLLIGRLTANNITLNVWTDAAKTNNILNKTITFTVNNFGFCMTLSLAGNALTLFRAFEGTFYISSASADSLGNIILGGGGRGTDINIRGENGASVGTLPYYGNQTGFLIKLTKNGQVGFNVWLATDIGDIQCDKDNNIVLSTYPLTGTLIITSGNGVQLYKVEKTASNGMYIVTLDPNGRFLYAKEIKTLSAGFYLYLFCYGKVVYCAGTQNKQSGLTVVNSDLSVEQYDYPDTPLNPLPNGENAFIYRYNLEVYNSPDPYSVGTSMFGSDNFAPFRGGMNPVASASLILNGAERFSVRNGDYFNFMQPYYHHTCIPKSRGINVYSFALKPEEHQPSGSCNFSRLDNSQLKLNFRSDIAGGIMKLYAVNYNVLRIMSGMGGLAYSN